MAIRIPWDKYEAAILLDACIKVIENKITRTAAIKRVSETLRQKAIRNGITIDSVYRNKNGISMQMNIMIALIQEKPSGLHGASQLFIDTVKLFKQDPSAFNEILQEAKKDRIIAASIKEQFYNWLDISARPVDIKYIKKLCDLVDSYTKSNKRFGFSIYEKEKLFDIQQVIISLEKDVFFRAKNGRQMHKIKKAMEKYYHFLKTSYASIKETVNAELSDYGTMKQESECIVDFSNNVDMAYTRPIRLLFDHEEYSDFSNWTQLYVKVLGLLYKQYYGKIINLCGKNINGNGRIEIAKTTQKEVMLAPKRFADDLYVETNISALDIIKKIHLLMDICGVDTKNVTIFYEKKKSETAQKIKISSVIEDNFSNVEFDRYRELLLKDYKKGFRINDKLSLKRFRMQWNSTFDEELQYDDETICKHIAHITIQHGDMAYLPEVMLDEDTKCRLLEYINTLFAEGKSAIYYKSLYYEFADGFASGRINNIEMLKTYLAYINNGQMYLRRNYIVADSNVEVDNTDEVRSFLISQGIPMQIDSIFLSLSHIAKDKIKLAISGSNSREFVRNQKGEYFHADIIEFTQHEIDLITEWISSAIDDKEYMGGKELTDTIQKELPSISQRYPFLTWLGLRDVLAYKLRDVFSFNGKIISRYGKDLSMSDVFANFAKTHDYFTLAQLNMLKNDLDTPIYFDSVYANSLRINENNFVSPNQAKFDIDATDAAIGNFCPDDFISVRDVSLFGGFPDAYFPWNHFLLQHYVANYSKKYKLMHAGFNAGKPVGAIVKRGSRIDTFENVIIRVLAENNIPLNSNDSLQYLYDAGYIARRSYSAIDTLLVKANLYRKNKGE